MFRLIAATIIALLITADAAGSADGSVPSTPGTGFETVSKAPLIGVIVWTEGEVSTPAGQWPRCTWRRLRADESIIAPVATEGEIDPLSLFIYRDRADGRREHLYIQNCDHADGEATFSFVFIPEVTPTDVVELARAELFEMAPDPVGGLSPDIGVNHLVGLATWVWLDDAPAPVTATATVPGLSATAVATATTLLVTPGDGSETTECAIDAPAYVAGADAADGCTHVFERISAHSASGTWDLQIDVEWEVTWTNTLGDAGVATPIVTSSVYPLDVIELQARIIDPNTVGD